MGTSLSGLTPATTFDGLLKTSDNEPLDGTLKAISTGEGTDTILQLSNSAFQVNGAATINGGQATIVGAGNDNTTTSLLVQNSDGDDVLQTLDNGSVGVGGAPNSSYRVHMPSGTLRFRDLLFGQNGSSAINNTSLLTMKWNGSTGIGISGGGAIDATARLHIKGSGASSGTTSLLVQNSAGNTSLEVLDNRDVKFNLGAYQFLGGGFTSFPPAYIVNNVRVGLGGGGTDVARLQVKGSGNDATTTALLVQNSAGNDLFKVFDSGATRINTETLSSTIIGKNGTGGSFIVDAGKVNNIRADVNGVAINSTPLTNTSLYIKGHGASSGTTALLVQNSAGTEHLKITDDGIVDVRQILNVNHPTVSSRALKIGWGSIFATDNGSELSIGAVFSQTTAPRIILGGKTRSSGADAIQVQALNGMYIATTANAENPSAQLHIKGSGDDNTTNALLIQNSASTPLDLFKVLDNGTLVAPNLPTSATGLPTGAIWNDGGTLKIA